MVDPFSLMRTFYKIVYWTFGTCCCLHSKSSFQPYVHVKWLFFQLHSVIVRHVIWSASRHVASAAIARYSFNVERLLFTLFLVLYLFFCLSKRADERLLHDNCAAVHMARAVGIVQASCATLLYAGCKLVALALGQACRCEVLFQLFQEIKP